MLLLHGSSIDGRAIAARFKKPARQKEFIIIDKELVHRIPGVLRLQVGDTCVFFDKKILVAVKYFQ